MGGKGSGGRNAKPTALKRLQGNPGKRKLNDAEPTPPTGAPTMPDWLDKEAKCEWVRIVPILEEMGLLSRADEKALAAYCSSFAQWVAADKMIVKHGPLVVERLSTGSRLKINPAVRVKSDALKLMKSFLIEFGLTPASRSRLSVSKGEEASDPFEEFLTGAAGATQPKPN
jgi:P27 family predicted phage terminase small subunit